MIVWIIMIIVGLWFVELVIDFLIGNVIDNINFWWGYFKLWIVIGGIIGFVVLVFLFMSLGGLNILNFILYLIIFVILYIIMDIFYLFKDVGFWLMILVILFDLVECEKMVIYVWVGFNIGVNIVGVIVMLIVLMFFVKFNSG